MLEMTSYANQKNIYNYLVNYFLFIKMRKKASPTKTTKYLNDILSCELRVCPKRFSGKNN